MSEVPPHTGRPAPSTDEASRRMKSTRQRDTAPELALRSELHRLGLRFRVDRSPLPDSRRRADIVFIGARVAVFLDGCYWHGCPQHGTWPKANADWWRQKIETNRRRDADTDERLHEAGWLAVRVWEHEAPSVAAQRIAAILVKRRPRGVGAGERREPRTAGGGDPPKAS